MDHWAAPPWNPTAAERPALDHATFRNCEEVLQTYVSRAAGRITGETYTVCQQWGKILRARVVFPLKGPLATTLVTCWSSDGESVEMLVKLDVPGG